MQEADLSKAQMQGAYLSKAQMQEAYLSEAQMQEAYLSEAQMQEAYLSEAQMQGADLSKARMQEARLFWAQMQGADLSEAQMQEARLWRVQMQGARLFRAQMQGARLSEAQMQGAQSQEQDYASFSELMEKSIGKESNLSGVIFAGGLSQKDVDSLVKDLPDEEANKLREKLEPHIGKPESKELPEDSHAITGSYTKEEAEQWIAEYEQAMSEVPEDDS